MEKTYNIPIATGEDGKPFRIGQKNINISKYFSGGWQRKIAEEARRYGYINYGNLIYILTMDKGYHDEIIQGLWNKYHQCRRNGEILEFRISFWQIFLEALVNRKSPFPNIVFNGLKEVPIIPLSFLDKDTGGIVKFNRKINPDGDGALILLSDLKDYFTGILRIPLPYLLFFYDQANTNESDLIRGVEDKIINQEDNVPELSDWYIPEPDFTQNPTDRNIYIDSIYAGPAGPRENPFENEIAHLCQYGTFTEGWLKNLYKNATVLGALRLYELVNYLALEDVYDDVLPILWEYCGFNDDPNDRFPKWDQKMLSDAHSRARVWYWILSRWTTYNYFIDGGFKVPNYYFHQLKTAVKLLPLYNHENGFEKVHENEPQSCKQYIKLNEFRDYLIHLKVFNIFVPLPDRLFSKDNEPAIISSITAKRLMQTWNIDRHELIQFLINGLRSYKPGGANLIDERLKDNIRGMAIRRVLGKHPEKAVSTLLFNIADLQEFKNRHPELPPIEIFRKKDSFDSEVQVEKQKTGKSQLLSCTPGTKWEDIKIALIADDTVRIETPNLKERFTYSELRLSDKRKGDAPKILWHLLVTFAKHRGEISLADNRFIENLIEHTKRLNKHLKILFGIPDSIFKGHYKKYRGYKTRIQFSDETQTLIERPASKSVREEIDDEFEELQNKYPNY